jgi:hypothetical protein
MDMDTESCSVGVGAPHNPKKKPRPLARLFETE